MKFYAIFLFIAIAVALFSMSSGIATKSNYNERKISKDFLFLLKNSHKREQKLHQINVPFLEYFFNVACNHDDDCYSLHTCHQERCINPCEVIKCGPNARCDYGLPHSAVCKCLLTHKGDPYTGCFEITGYDIRNLPRYSNYGYFSRKNI
ncbi:hypothetical protein PV326_002656 [Microctonus aethiopoides]|nr:hypothetical protein PV326_002656 [Microctonus aethiopoides]